MTAPTKVLIDDVPVELDGPVSWRQSQGVQPVQETFYLPLGESVARLQAISSSPVTLTIQSGDGPPEIFSRLYIVGFPPGPDPQIQGVTLADIRYWFPYSHIRREFNIRRATGFKRLEADNQEVAPVVSSLWYAAYSMRNPLAAIPTKWSAREVMNEVLSDVVRKTGKTGVRFIIEGDAMSNALPVEDLLLDDPGPAAVARALSYMPEAGMTVAADGVIVIFNKAGGGETDVLSDIPSGPEGPFLVRGEGNIGFVTNEIIRPRAVDVLFTRAVEVRFEFFSEGSFSDADRLRILENVLPIPDFNLNIIPDPVRINPFESESPRRPYIAPAGTYVQFDDAINSWNADGAIPILGPLSDAMIRVGFVPYMGTLAAIIFADNFDGASNWTSRVAAIQEHYRTTFRIPRRIMDAVSRIEAGRVSMIDQATGTRTPSPVYADYCLVPSVKYYSSKEGDPNLMIYGINMDSYPGEGIGALLSGANHAAPATLQVIDPDQGIIHVNFVTESLGRFNTIYPSHIDNMPGGDMAQTLLPSSLNPFGGKSAWDMLPATRRDLIASLKKQHNLTTVMTVYPAAPNDDRSLHRIRVLPGDIAALLPPGGRQGLQDARGPVWEARVGPGLEVARVAWFDDRKAETERLLGLRAGTPNLSGMVMNDGDAGSATGGASLKAIARAVAARIYASMADRNEGQAAVPFQAGMRIAGSIEEILYSTKPDGSTLARLSLAEKLPDLPMLSFLDASSRAIILRQPKS